MITTNQLPFTSIKFIKETDEEYIYRCPFCMDSDNKSHAHLYISKRYPIFYCQKCTTHGNIKLLEYKLHEKCKIEYNTSLQYDLPNLNIKKILYEVKELIKYQYFNISDIEKEYFKSRTRLKKITLDNAIKFSLFPDNFCRYYIHTENKEKFNKIDLYKNDYMRVWTIRGFGSGISGRSIVKDFPLRYMNGIVKVPWKDMLDLDSYFIRSKVLDNLNEVPNNLIISEGIYDCISIYLNRNRFLLSDNDSLYVAVQCSLYNRAIKIFNMIYNCYPRNIIIFADVGISIDILKKQFSNLSNVCDTIIVNYPMIKDWDPIGLVKHSIRLY